MRVNKRYLDKKDVKQRLEMACCVFRAASYLTLAPRDAPAWNAAWFTWEAYSWVIPWTLRHLPLQNNHETD